MQCGLAVASRVETWKGGGVKVIAKQWELPRNQSGGREGKIGALSVCRGRGGGGQNFSESCIWAADNAVISISLQNASSAPSAGNL